MYVKAFGTLLYEISLEKGWLKQNINQWREDCEHFHFSDEDEFVTINTNNTIEGERASIETGLHALLPHKYVLHTHFVYANIFLCGGETQKFIDYIHFKENIKIIVVPTCAPGLQLTNHLYKQSPQNDLLIKGKRRNRRFLEAFFTFGMQCYVNYRLGTKLSDINTQPKLFSAHFFKDIRKKAPYDFSLDLYVLYHAYKKGVIKTITVDFINRTDGEAKGGGSWSTRIKLIKRTLDYVNKFTNNK